MKNVEYIEKKKFNLLYEKEEILNETKELKTAFLITFIFAIISCSLVLIDICALIAPMILFTFSICLYVQERYHCLKFIILYKDELKRSNK